MGTVQEENSMSMSMSIGKCDLIGSSSCSFTPMVDSFICTTFHDDSTSSLNLGFHDMRVPINVSRINALGIREGGPASLRNGIDRTLGIFWNLSSSIVEKGYFLAKYAWN